MKHTVIRLDDMDSIVRSAVYVESENRVDIDNGALVVLKKPYKDGADRELFQAEKAGDLAKDELVLVTTPEDDEKLFLDGFALEKFYNRKDGRPIRTHSLLVGNIFSVSKEGFTGDSASHLAVGKFVTGDTTTNKLKAVASKPETTTNRFIGEIIRIDKPSASVPVELVVIRILNA